MEHDFCAVFLHRKRLFLAREEKVGGPRRMILPPRELVLPVDSSNLGDEVLRALADYRNADRSLTPSDWEEGNAKLLELMAEPSVESFERRKRDVTVRRSRDSGEVTLFGPNRRQVSLEAPDVGALGDAVKGLLGI